MKKFVLLFLAGITLASKGGAQTSGCKNIAPKHWAYPGQRAPITIGSTPTSISDWESTGLLGPLQTGNNNFYAPSEDFAGNFFVDGILGSTNPAFRDADVQSGATKRDLRFFAFTYDNDNVYFFFRRNFSESSQVNYIYFCDINGDGHMSNGEPVFEAFTTNNGAGIKLNRFEVNTGAAGYSTTFQGNRLTHPITELADGYSVQGTMQEIKTPGIALTTAERFAVGRTSTGEAVEFSVPWKYFRNWNTGQSLRPGDIFTYHISVVDGNSGFNTADDNAGGCCGGLATSGAPNYVLDGMGSSYSTLTSNLKYRAKLQYNNLVNIPTKIYLNNLEFSDIIQRLGLPIQKDGFNFNVEGYLDANKNGILESTEQASKLQFNYVKGSFEDQPIIYRSPYDQNNVNPLAVIDAPPATRDVNGNLIPGKAYFFVDITLPSNYSVMETKVNYGSKGEFDLSSVFCLTTGNEIGEIASGMMLVTALPVKFQSFTAARNRANRQQVDLVWETAMEQNNRGFHVQRKTEGEWKDIAFVFSAANGGNSNSTLRYAFKDQNTHKGVSQYRLLQVDLDGKGSYSDVKSLMGEAQKEEVILFPNPAKGGKVNLVFSDAASRNITLSDVNGRILKQYRNHASGSLVIEGLSTGFYTLSVSNNATGTASQQKLIVP